MPISDPRYIVLLIPVVAGLYMLPSGRARMLLVLIVSYLYYLTFPLPFFAALCGITLVAYVGGKLIERSDGKRSRASIITGCLFVCFLPMVVYKYVIPIWVDAATRQSESLWIFPVGLSFYTFAAAGYLVDVALGVVDAEKRPLRVALFCAFFPTVTMGPVMRTTFFDQLLFKRNFDMARGIRGGSEILMGVVLKLWFADSLAIPCNQVYADVSSSPPLEQFVASIFEAFQVYADWLGYSMIAIGSARLLGVDLPENFRQPYLSTNMGEFWRNWNISLINWLRDYVFTPIRLQFLRWPALATPIAIILTFTLLGTWHAAGWGYLLYGLVNGILVAGSQLTLRARDRFWQAAGVPLVAVKAFRVPITFIIVVLTIPLVRANNLGDALYIYHGIFSTRFFEELYHVVVPTAEGSGFRHIHFGWDVLLIAGLIVADIVAISKRALVFPIPIAVTAVVNCVCVGAILIYAMSGWPIQPFVYFRF